MAHTSVPRVSCLFLLLLALTAPTRANTTLMILVDWWLSQPTDTIFNLKVYQPADEIPILMVTGSPVPDLVLTSATTTEKFSWWYALPNFHPDSFVNGRIRIFTQYYRGWYQNDSTYRAKAGDTLFLPDSQTTFTCIETTTGSLKTVPLQTKAPKFYVFEVAGTYRGPKLYASPGNARTDLLNQRTKDAEGKLTPGTGRLDRCIDSLKSDTVWIRWGTPMAPPGAAPKEAQMKCFGRNPFLLSPTSVRGTFRKKPVAPTLGIDRAGRLEIRLPGAVDPSGRK